MEVADHRRSDRPGRGAARDDPARRGRRVLDGDAARRGRTHRGRAAHAGRHDARRDAGAIQRAHARARVRRAVLLGRGRRGVVRQLRRPAALPAGAGRGAGGHHSRGRGPALWRRHGGPRARPPGVRPRGPPRCGARSGQHRHRGGPGGRRRRRGSGVRQRFLRLPGGEPGRHPAGVAGMEPSAHALGRERAVGGRPACRRLGRRAAEDRRRTGRVRVPAGVVPRRRAPFRLGPERLVEPVPLAGRAVRGDGADGRRVRGAGMAARHPDVRLRVGRPHRLPVRARGPLARGGAGHTEQAADPGRDPLHRAVARRHQGRPRPGGDGGCLGEPPQLPGVAGSRQRPDHPVTGVAEGHGGGGVPLRSATASRSRPRTATQPTPCTTRRATATSQARRRSARRCW